MNETREGIMGNVLQLLRQLADDWEYPGEITPETYFFADMGFESLDIVVLATSIQEYYGQVLPFPELFAELGQREIPDISVGDWVDFVHKHLDAASTRVRRARVRE